MMMMKPVDHHDSGDDDDDDDDGRNDDPSAGAVQNPNDPPGDYYSHPRPQPPDIDNYTNDSDEEDADDDGLASLSTMNTSTFRRLRDRRRQHPSNSEYHPSRLHHHADYRLNSRSHGENISEGSSSLFSSSTSMRTAAGWKNNSTNNIDHHRQQQQQQQHSPPRRFMGGTQRPRWAPLSSSPHHSHTNPNNSGSNSRSTTTNNRISSIGSSSLREKLSWQHVVLYLGMMGFWLVVWRTGSDIMATPSTSTKSNELYTQGVGLGMDNNDKNTEGGDNKLLMDSSGAADGELRNNNNYVLQGGDEKEEFDDENAVLSTFDNNVKGATVEEKLLNIHPSVVVGSEVLDNAQDATMVREDKGEGGGQPQQLLQSQQQQLQLLPQQEQQKQQLDPMLQAPHQLPPLVEESSPLSNILSNQQQQVPDVGLVDKVVVDGGVIVASNNNTSIYYDGIADDNPRLWGVKE